MRNLVIVAVALSVAAAAVGGYVLARTVADPDPAISPLVLPGLAAPTTVVGTGSLGTVAGSAAGDVAATSTTRPMAEQVQGLYQLVGVLRSGKDVGDWSVSGVDVDFGPDGWIATAGALEDYDGDGRREPFLEELRGLRGRQVTVAARFGLDDDDLDDAEAVTIEGLAFRDPAGGPAPWQTRPVGVEATREQVVAAAVAAAGAGAVATDLDRDDSDGWVRWEVEVRAANGRDYDVYVDVAGIVLDIRPDGDNDLLRRAVNSLDDLVS